MPAMPGGDSLSKLLSQVLVSFAIEFDNEFESRLTKTWARPFRVSIVMWSNFMSFLNESGTRFEDLVEASRIARSAVASVAGGMERWGYATIDHDPAHGTRPIRKGFGTARGIRPDTLIYPSMTGKLAIDLWKPLVSEIEGRWQERLGETPVEGLRQSLREVQTSIGLAMPRFLPVLSRSGLFADPLEQGSGDGSEDLPTLLSRVLLAFTLDFEKSSEVSLPLAANVLRVLDGQVLAIKDLPQAAGVAKEAVSVAMTWLEKNGYIITEADPNARGKVARSTPKGTEAHSRSVDLLDEVEVHWESRFGSDALRGLRSSLLSILDQRGGDDGPLSAGLVPPTGCWRGEGRYKKQTAALIKSPRDALPHYPMVLHRGGWPDGS